MIKDPYSRNFETTNFRNMGAVTRAERRKTAINAPDCVTSGSRVMGNTNLPWKSEDGDIWHYQSHGGELISRIQPRRKGSHCHKSSQTKSARILS